MIKNEVKTLVIYKLAGKFQFHNSHDEAGWAGSRHNQSFPSFLYVWCLVSFMIIKVTNTGVLLSILLHHN